MKCGPYTQEIFAYRLNNMKRIPPLLGPVNCGLYKQVVFIYRWSLEQVCLHIKKII